LTSNCAEINESEFRVTDRVVALIVILVLTAASIDSIAAYVTNPLLNHISRADQSVPLSGDRPSGALKAERLLPKRDAPLRHGSEVMASPAAAGGRLDPLAT
jgi:hypothetical protein